MCVWTRSISRSRTSRRSRPTHPRLVARGPSRQWTGVSSASRSGTNASFQGSRYATSSATRAGSASRAAPTMSRSVPPRPRPLVSMSTRAGAVGDLAPLGHARLPAVTPSERNTSAQPSATGPISKVARQCARAAAPSRSPLGERPGHPGGQALHIARAHEEPGLAVAHDLRHAADVGRHRRAPRQSGLDQHAGHALGPAARHHDVGRGQRLGGTGQHPGEVGTVAERLFRPPLERRAFGTVAGHQQVRAVDGGHRVDGVGDTLLGGQRTDHGHDRHTLGDPQAGAGRGPRRGVRHGTPLGRHAVGQDVEPAPGHAVERVDGVGGPGPQRGDGPRASEQQPGAQAAHASAGPGGRIADAAVHDRRAPPGQGEGARGQRA